MPYVYRYIDKADNIIKYVGIVISQTVRDRVIQHSYSDIWSNSSNFKIQYFEVLTRCDAEMWEAHLIAEYKTFNYYNVQKASWGMSSYLDSSTIQWKNFRSTNPKTKRTNLIIPRKEEIISVKYIQSTKIRVESNNIFIEENCSAHSMEDIVATFSHNDKYAKIISPTKLKARKNPGYRIVRKDINKIIISPEIYHLLKENGLLDEYTYIGSNIEISPFMWCGIYWNHSSAIFGYFDEDNISSALHKINQLENAIKNVIFNK